MHNIPSWMIGTWVLPGAQYELRLMSDNSASIVKDEKKQLGKFDTTRDKIIIDMVPMGSHTCDLIQ